MTIAMNQDFDMESVTLLRRPVGTPAPNQLYTLPAPVNPSRLSLEDPYGGGSGVITPNTAPPPGTTGGKDTFTFAGTSPFAGGGSSEPTTTPSGPASGTGGLVLAVLGAAAYFIFRGM